MKRLDYITDGWNIDIIMKHESPKPVAARIVKYLGMPPSKIAKKSPYIPLSTESIMKAMRTDENEGTFVDGMVIDILRRDLGPQRRYDTDGPRFGYVLKRSDFWTEMDSRHLKEAEVSRLLGRKPRSIHLWNDRTKKPNDSLRITEEEWGKIMTFWTGQTQKVRKEEDREDSIRN